MGCKPDARVPLGDQAASADLGEVGLRVAQGAHFERHTGLPVARLRLKAAIAASGEPLPLCSALVEADLAGGTRSIEDLTAEVKAALDELTPLLRSTAGGGGGPPPA